MNKNEFEIQKAAIKAGRFEVGVGLIKHALTLGTVLVAIKFIFDGIKPFIGQNADSIAAFAKLVAAINPSNITGYIVGAIGVVGWGLERNGKQRAIREKSSLQKKLEAHDKYRSSSGLTEIGQTPEE